jgi:hypothetical protein
MHATSRRHCNRKEMHSDRIFIWAWGRGCALDLAFFEHRLTASGEKMSENTNQKRLTACALVTLAISSNRNRCTDNSGDHCNAGKLCAAASLRRMT